MYTYMGNSVADSSFSTVSYANYYGNTKQAVTESTTEAL